MAAASASTSGQLSLITSLTIFPTINLHILHAFMHAPVLCFLSPPVQHVSQLLPQHVPVGVHLLPSALTRRVVLSSVSSKRGEEAGSESTFPPRSSLDSFASTQAGH